MRRAIGALAIALVSLGARPQDHTANAGQFLTSAPAVIMSTKDMQDNGVMFGDEPIGFSNDSDGRVVAFSAGGSFSGVDRHGALPAGTYKFTGTLDHLVPSLSADHQLHYSLTTGLEQPSPDGSDFDRDYAGGGPTYSLVVPDKPKDAASGQRVLLQVYHGEYHYGHPSSMPAYGGSGLAVSFDSGASFKKLGQILYSHLGREDYLKTNPKGGLWSDGAMIAADSFGHHVSNVSPTVEGYSSIYYYFLFTERNAPEEMGNSISLARIKAGDLVQAITQHRTPVLRKYFNPVGAGKEGKDLFTEPGVGGRSTPMVEPGRFEFINSPYVIYDAQIKKFILSYQISQKRIVIRTADDLYHWSLPVELVNLEHDENQRLFNPSIAGLGADPQVSGGEFYIYYLQRTDTKNGLREPRLMRLKVTLNSHS